MLAGRRKRTGERRAVSSHARFAPLSSRYRRVYTEPRDGAVSERSGFASSGAVRECAHSQQQMAVCAAGPKASRDQSVHCSSMVLKQVSTRTRTVDGAAACGQRGNVSSLLYFPLIT